MPTPADSVAHSLSRHRPAAVAGLPRHALPTDRQLLPMSIPAQWPSRIERAVCPAFAVALLVGNEGINSILRTIWFEISTVSGMRTTEIVQSNAD